MEAGSVKLQSLICSCFQGWRAGNDMRIRLLHMHSSVSCTPLDACWDKSACKRLHPHMPGLLRLEGEPNNYYRLLRVYEIVLETGQPLAQLDASVDAEPDYDFRCFFLNRPRMELYRRIDARCEQMLHALDVSATLPLLDRR